MFEALIEYIENANDARQRVKTGESNAEEVDWLLGLKLKFRRGPDDTVETHVGDGARTEFPWSRTFPGSEERPPSYPADLPFLPSVSVSILEFQGRKGRNLTWHRVSHVPEKAASVRRQLLQSGWVLEEEKEVFLGLFGHEFFFRRGQASRKLTIQVNLWGRTKLGMVDRDS